MLDDFFTRAVLAGIGVALIAGPFGCFIVWRRMSYFGDTLAHSALLGVVLGLVLELNLMLAVFLICALASLMLVALRNVRVLPTDAVLGMLSHSTLALGLVALGMMTWLRVDLNALLFGDILSVSKADLVLIYGLGAILVTLLIFLWTPLLASTVSADIARAEGLPDRLADVFFMLMVAAVVAVSMRLVGVLLVTALLIIPAITVRPFCRTPQAMAAAAALAGVLSVVLGLWGSLSTDSPSGPSIVVAAFILFLASLFTTSVLNRMNRGNSQ